MSQRHATFRVVLRRLAMAPPLLISVSAVSFVLLSITPGDAAEQILGANAPAEAYARLRAQLGLNLPLYEQYWRWFKHAIRGDLGQSVFTGQNVTREISERLAVTLSLVGLSIGVIFLFGIAFGVFSAANRGRLARFVDAIVLGGYAIPSFWAGALLIAFFAVKLHWLPATGYVPFTHSVSGWARTLVLPVVALSLQGVAGVAKQTREAMLDVLGSEHIRMARANGIPEWSILFRHGLKIAAIRAITVLGIYAIALTGGTVFVESVFAIPGLGGLAVTASTQKDFYVVEGTLVIFTLLTVAINLLTDLAYSWLNPRIRSY